VDDVELAARAYVAGCPLVVSVRTMQRLAGLMGVNRLVYTDRYFSYQLLDAWTESFAYVGTRRPAAGPAPGWSGADGSLEIVLAHDEPAAPDGAAVNWLPVPAGPFVLMLRL
jgi:hypothetical protein